MNTDLIARLRKQANMCASPTTWGEAADYIEQLESSKRDAARYKWLEGTFAIEGTYIDHYGPMAPRPGYCIVIDNKYSNERYQTFGEAIDAAIAAENWYLPTRTADQKSCAEDLVKALQFYADGKHVKDGVGWDSQPSIEDGEVAREALAKAGTNN